MVAGHQEPCESNLLFHARADVYETGRSEWGWWPHRSAQRQPDQLATDSRYLSASSLGRLDRPPASSAGLSGSVSSVYSGRSASLCFPGPLDRKRQLLVGWPWT